MKTHTIDMMTIEGHLCRYDDLTNEIHIGSEFVGTLKTDSASEYFSLEDEDGDYMSEVHVNQFSSFDNAFRWACTILIGSYRIIRK